MPSITLYELGHYNQGRLMARTFDLKYTHTYHDWISSVSAWMSQLTRDMGTLCEEWMVADTDDIPAEFVGSYSIDVGYWAYRAAVDASYLDKEVFDAAVALSIPLEMVEAVYQGEYEGDVEFAYSLAEDLGLLQDAVRWPYTSIDWEFATRDLMYDYAEQNGHYFRTDY